MPLIVNLRHLEAHNVRLEGSLPVEELDIDTRDEVIQVRHPLEHDLEVQKLEGGLLVQGRLRLDAGMPVRPLPQAVPTSPRNWTTGPAICPCRARIASPWSTIAWT